MTAPDARQGEGEGGEEGEERWRRRAAVTEKRASKAERSF
jgi:hypothetical protein